MGDASRDANGRSAFVEAVRQRTGYELPASYEAVVLARPLLSRRGRWTFVDPAHIHSIEEVYDGRSRGVVIAEDVGGDMLVLLRSKEDPKRLGDSVFELDHETRRVRWRAADLGAFFAPRTRGPRLSLAALERAAKDPIDEGLRTIANSAAELAERGFAAEAAPILTLLEKLGPISIATASLHLRRPAEEVASAVASLLAALQLREDGGEEAEHQHGR